MKTRLFWALIFAGVFFLLFKGPFDPDFGWHYRYGEYTFNTHSFLRDNIYSYTFADYAWANSYWIPQVIMYFLISRFGSLGFSFVLSATASLALYFYVRKMGKKAGVGQLVPAVLMLLLAVIFSNYLLPVRPLFFSTLLMMLFVGTLLKGGRLLYLLPILFLVWANTHADFTLGLFFLGLFAATEFVKNFRAHGRVFAFKQATLHGFLFLISAISTLVNPFGLGLWKTLLKESHPFQFKYISEWVPVGSQTQSYFVLYCGLLGLALVVLYFLRGKISWWLVLSILFTAAASIRAQYFLRIFLLLSVYPISLFAADFYATVKPGLSEVFLSKLRKALLLLMIFGSVSCFGVFSRNFTQLADFTFNDFSKQFPESALSFANQKKLTGNLFNYYGWGGYIIWKYPQYKTFVDGRMPSWREGSYSVFEDYINITDTPKNYAHLLDKYEVSWVLFPAEDDFTKWLRTQPDQWEKVYEDSLSTIFVRKYQQENPLNSDIISQ